jgi:hypothetical protein
MHPLIQEHLRFTDFRTHLAMRAELLPLLSDADLGATLGESWRDWIE